jgi:tetratricopeptide (TPR) repeat protein
MENVLSFRPTDLAGQPGVDFQLPASLNLSPEARTCFQQGLVKLQTAEPAEAVELLSRVVELAPRFPEARVCLGLAFALTHDIYPALDQLELAGQLDPESFAAHFTLAKLNFKLRVPQKGYAAAQNALRCVTTIEQRKLLTELLREENARKQSGIARPWFNKPFSKPAVFLMGSGLAAVIIALLAHVRW